MEYMTQSYAQRQAALEQAKAAFLQAGGQIVVLDTLRSKPAAEFNGTFAQVSPKPQAPKGRTGDEALAQRLKLEAQAGHCLTKAAMNLGIHHGMAKRVAGLFGIAFPPGVHAVSSAARAANASAKEDERDAERLRAMASIGVNISQAAKHMGYGRPRVQRIADQYGIEFKPGRKSSEES